MLNPAILNTYPILPRTPHPYHHTPRTSTLTPGSTAPTPPARRAMAMAEASAAVPDSNGAVNQPPAPAPLSEETKAQVQDVLTSDVRSPSPRVPESDSPLLSCLCRLRHAHTCIPDRHLGDAQPPQAEHCICKGQPVPEFPTCSTPPQRPSSSGCETNHAPVSRSLPNSSRSARSLKTNMPTRSRSCASCRRTACSAATTGAAPLAAHTTR